VGLFAAHQRGRKRRNRVGLFAAPESVRKHHNREAHKCARSPSRKGRRCLDRGSTITEVGTRPGTIPARVGDPRAGGEEVGLFAVCFNDGEHHNQEGAIRGSAIT
jgi:hypothetical protein